MVRSIYSLTRTNGVGVIFRSIYSLNIRTNSVCDIFSKSILSYDI